MGIEGVLSPATPRAYRRCPARRAAETGHSRGCPAPVSSAGAAPAGRRRASVWPGFALSTAISDIILKPLQHDLADGASGFQLAMRFLQIGGGDGAVVFAKGGFDSVVVDQRRHAGEQLMLGDHIIRLKH